MSRSTLLIVLALSACGNDTQIAAYTNVEPTAHIASPSGEETVFWGTEVTAWGLVSDPETPADQLRVRWLLGSEVQCEGLADADGNTECTLPVADTADLHLEVRDDREGVAIDSVMLDIAPPGIPVGQIDAPVAGGDYPSDRLVTLRGRVWDAEDAPGDLTATWESQLDGLLSEELADDLGSVEDHVTLSEGEHAITLTVTDTDGRQSTTSVVVLVEAPNEAPVLAGGTLEPAPTRVGDVLECQPGASSDADGDAVTIELSWTVNGAAATGTPLAVGSLFDTVGLRRNDRVDCTLIPWDGTEYGAPVVLSSTLVNTPPNVSQVEIGPTEPTTDDDLLCAWSWSDADGDAESVSVTWLVDGVDTGLSANPLPAGSAPGGSSVECQVTPNDGVEDGDTVISAPVSVTQANSAPTLSSAALSPTTGTVADTFSCTPGVATDPDGDPVGFTYAWFEGAAVLAGHTGPTLAGTVVSKGATLRCEVTPNDGVVDGSTVASNPVTLENAPPSLAGVTLNPTAPTSTTPLIATPGATQDPDGDAVQIDWAWSRHTGAAVGGNSPTLASSLFSRGDRLRVTATPIDSAGLSGGPVQSAEVVIGNTPPVFSSLTITPLNPTSADDLTAVTSGWSDADGDAEGYQHSWKVNGIVRGSSLTLPATEFGAGDTVELVSTAHDGLDAGTQLTAAVTPGNAAPSVASVQILPSPLRTTDTASASPSGWADPEGAAEGYHYAWTVDGAPAGTSPTLSPSAFAFPQQVSLTLTPWDGSSTGAPVSASVAVANSAPSIIAASISPAAPTATDTLSASGSGWADADGHAEGYDVAWQVNGGSTVAAPTLSGLSKNDVVTLTLTPNDGFDTGGARTATVTVGNSAPSASSVAIQPSAPRMDDTLSADVTGWFDADGDLEGYDFVWRVNGSVAGTSATLPPAAFDGDDTVSVQVTPNDGSDTGAPLTASTTIDPTIDCGGWPGRPIATCQDLYDITGAHDYCLVQDVDCNGFPWSSAPTLGGKLDGRGHTIRKVQSTGNQGGVFAALDSASEVANVHIEDVQVTGITSGGLATLARGWVHDVTVTGLVSGTSSAGGLAASSNSVVIEDCHTDVDVHMTGTGGFSGLLVAHAQNTVIRRSSGVGSADGGYAGLVGYGAASFELEESWADADLDGTYTGLVGGNLGAIRDSWSMGTSSGTRRGGLAGVNDGSIERSWTAMKVPGTGGDVGGLSGLERGVVTDSYWDLAMSGQTTSTAGTGLSTLQMVTTSSYTGLDYGSVWRQQDGVTYPCHQWDAGACPEPPPHEYTLLAWSNIDQYLDVEVTIHGDCTPAAYSKHSAGYSTTNVTCLGPMPSITVHSAHCPVGSMNCHLFVNEGHNMGWHQNKRLTCRWINGEQTETSQWADCGTGSIVGTWAVPD